MNVPSKWYLNLFFVTKDLMNFEFSVCFGHITNCNYPVVAHTHISRAIKIVIYKLKRLVCWHSTP